MANAFYYREGYYLLPEGFSSPEELKAGVAQGPVTVEAPSLLENHKIRSTVEKGVCIAPYFYNEYGYPRRKLVLEDAEEIFPVEVTLLSQKEYNDRLREIITAYCPGCVKYKPLTNRVQSLNGHFEEISLNSVCMYRQCTRPSPRAFRNLLWSYGGLAYHNDPAARTAEDAAWLIKSMCYLRYARCEKAPEEPVLHVEHKPDFFLEQLTAALSDYITKHLDFTTFRIDAPAPSGEIRTQVAALLAPEKREAYQKECKKYGVSLAFLQFDPEQAERVKRSLESLLHHDFARLLYEDRGVLCLLLMYQGPFLKELRFRAPFLESCHAAIRVFDQYGTAGYRISFDMEPAEDDPDHDA